MKAALSTWRSLQKYPVSGRPTTSLREVTTSISATIFKSQPVGNKVLASAVSVKTHRLISSSVNQANFESKEPTIYALSTAAGRAAIAVIRISGPACLTIYQALCPGRSQPKARYASVRSLYEPNRPAITEHVLDSSALVLYFPGPRTVTGEDVLELHVHGGPAVVKAVLSAIPRSSDRAVIRYAEPGEFTRRAFMNDRLDLTQVEALGDTLSATTEQQRRLSVRGTTSSLAKTYEQWRQQLLYARGELEALIDFSEDQHFDESPAELCTSVAEQVMALRSRVQAHSANAVRGELLRKGISISLLGAPNAGKSSLLNRIVGREAAIVSQEAGTTRDIVEVGLDLGGYFCRLGDTAGLRKAMLAEAQQSQGLQHVIGHVEQEGMRRAKERAQESDVVIVVLNFQEGCHSAERAAKDPRLGSYGYDGYEIGSQLHLDSEVLSTATVLVQGKDNVLVVINKIDRATPASLADAVSAIQAAMPGLQRDRIHLISCKNAEDSVTTEPDPGGIQRFLTGLIDHFKSITTALSLDCASETDPAIWQESLGATERHRLLLEQCRDHLDNFLEQLAEAADDDVDIVVAAESLRSAADCLAKITGKGEAGDVEEVLGVVFEKFCVGK